MTPSYYARRSSDCRDRAILLAVVAITLLLAVIAFAANGAPFRALGSSTLFVWSLFAAAMQGQKAAHYEDRETIRQHLRATLRPSS